MIKSVEISIKKVLLAAHITVVDANGSALASAIGRPSIVLRNRGTELKQYEIQYREIVKLLDQYQQLVHKDVESLRQMVKTFTAADNAAAIGIEAIEAIVK